MLSGRPLQRKIIWYILFHLAELATHWELTDRELNSQHGGSQFG